MARLSDLDRAVVAEIKIANYLLSRRASHRADQGSVSRKFRLPSQPWHVLRDAIIDHAAANDIAALTSTEFGTKYEIDGPLISPDGRNPIVRVVWFVEAQERVPRLVTLIPRIVVR